MSEHYEAQLKRQLAEARATNQRLNHRAQQAEHALAVFHRAVAEWRLTDTSTYVPLRSIAAIAKAAGREIPDEHRWEMHYQRVETAEAELAALHAGEELYEDERVRPTPAQWIWLWNRATPAQRLAKAEQINGLHDIVDRCTGGFHEQKIEQYDRDRQAARFRAEQAEARIAAALALHHDDMGNCAACSGLYGVPWPCPTATALQESSSTIGGPS